MINRKMVNKVLDVMDAIGKESIDLTINQDGEMDFKVYPRYWWQSGVKWTDERRHEVLGLVTPLVGKLEKIVSGKDIGYQGQKDSLQVRMNYVDQCKIVGYKTVKKMVEKEVEREPEYVTEEIEERVAITDCDIRQGKFSQEDIEVKA